MVEVSVSRLSAQVTGRGNAFPAEGRWPTRSKERILHVVNSSLTTFNGLSSQSMQYTFGTRVTGRFLTQAWQARFSIRLPSSLSAVTFMAPTETRHHRLTVEAMQDNSDSRIPSDGYDVPLNPREGPQTISYSKLRLGASESVVEAPRPEPEDEFERLMAEGWALLKEGEQGLKGQLEVGVASRMLKEAADFFESAVALKPSDLKAIESWGNALLVHGKLKLRLSEHLRLRLLQLQSQIPPTNRNNWLDMSAAEDALFGVCEESEDLLVEAGRKYQMALSLDKTDDCALYNWGLALYHRGELIAADGDEEAIEGADKIYSAAIAKFEAALAVSKTFAPGALLNLGLAFRDRSWLRPMDSEERIELMQQAKVAFQEALRYDPDYVQAKRAVEASTKDLKKLEDLNASKVKRAQRKKPENWWDWS